MPNDIVRKERSTTLLEEKTLFLSAGELYYRRGALQLAVV